MRKEATIKNSIAGLFNRVATLVFVFLVRHYFTHYLTTEYLGFEGLFQNLLGLFSLIDMGLGTAIAFDLYEPIYKNERKQISSIMNLYKKIYSLIGIIIFIMSLFFVPFLLNFISGYTINGNYIRLYFLIYAFGVAVSYFFSYKRTLLFAIQKNYIVTNVDTVAKVLGSICQIFILIFWQNYFLYLIVVALINIISNLIISILTDKGDYYDKNNSAKLSVEYKQKLTEHIKALAVTNIAWQGIASTDNIIISAMVGIIDLAKNANYATIVTAINGISSSVLGGVSASIGDLIAEGNKQKIKEYFDKYCFIYAIVASYAALGVYFVSKSVITLWVGASYNFDSFPVLLISINLYLALMFKPMVDYQNLSGCFVYYKSYSIVALFINLFVSIVGAKLIGISGVFLGTTLTYAFMCFIVLRIVFEHVFKMRTRDYYYKMLKVNIPLIVSALLLFVIYKTLPSINAVVEFLIMVTLVTIIYCGTVLIILRKEPNLKFFKELFYSLIRKIARLNH